MRRHAAAIALGSLAVLLPGQGAESTAPLQSSKQGLRKLESGQTGSRGPDAKEGLRAETPGLSIPGQESLPAPVLVTPDKLEKQRKTEKERAESQNWLVNGVRRLEAADKRTALEPGRSQNPEATEALETAPPDASEPQSLLRLYDEQKKVEETRQTGALTSKMPAADPLAPFLQGWLGNSPSRGPAFDDFIRKGTSGDSPAQTGGVVLPGSARSADNPGATANLAAMSPGQSTAVRNPYLESPVSAGTGLESLGRTSAPSNLGPSLNAAAGPLSVPPVAPPVPLPESRPAERKAPPPPQGEDKKYFPQLNKF